MANCADCGKDLDEMDMAMGACQGCREMLTPDTVQVLREAFGQVQVSPDIAPPPVRGLTFQMAWCVKNRTVGWI